MSESTVPTVLRWWAHVTAAGTTGSSTPERRQPCREAERSMPPPLVVTALGLVVGLLVLARTRRLAPALAAFFLRLTGAWLLRLAEPPP